MAKGISGIANGNGSFRGRKHAGNSRRSVLVAEIKLNAKYKYGKSDSYD